jgi:DNA invertase Pin-like site-specific DNA recombinase
VPYPTEGHHHRFNVPHLTPMQKSPQQDLTRLDAWGVAWRSYSEPFFDSCGIMRDVVISIMATLAEQERISISERTKAGLARAKRSGKVWAGRHTRWTWSR